MDDKKESDEFDFDSGDNLPTKWIDDEPAPPRNYKTNPFPKDIEIVRAFFALRPRVKTDSLAIEIVAAETGRHPDKVASIITKFKAKEEAKVQRREYADAIYGEKIPLAKAIVAHSLSEVYEFIKTTKPTSYEEVRVLTSIAKDINGLLRLELGQSTHNVDVLARTEKTVNVIVEELKENDPFVEYAEIKEITDGGEQTES